MWIRCRLLASRVFLFEDQVCRLDDLPHDGDEDDLGRLAAGCEPVGEGLEARIRTPCGQCGHVDEAPWSLASAADEALALPCAAVAIERSNPEQGAGLAVIHGAEFGHADHQGCGVDGADAGKRRDEIEAPGEIGAGADASDQVCSERLLAGGEDADVVCEISAQVGKPRMLAIESSPAPAGLRPARRPSSVRRARPDKGRRPP